jgi:methanethiol S-methyltransferase
MWMFWVSFVVFLAEPTQLLSWWPLPTVNRGAGPIEPWLAALIDFGLIALFGAQHSVMARPWFKVRIMVQMTGSFERCTYVHMANMALFALIVFWQPIPREIWAINKAVWSLFVAGWLMLFLGANEGGPNSTRTRSCCCAPL